MTSTLRTLFILFFFIIGVREGNAQKTFKASPLGLQLKQILDNGSTEYKKLRLGKGVPGDNFTVYNSSIKTANTLKSTISCMDNCHYVILIGENIEEDAAATMFAKWSNLILEALGKDFTLESKTKKDDLYVLVEDKFTFEGVYNQTTGKMLRKFVILRMGSYDHSPSNIELYIRVTGF